LLAGVAFFGRRERRGEYADALALAGCLGWGVGRLGCFIQHDHVSAPSDSPFAVLVGGVPRLDLGLAEALLCLGLGALLAALGPQRLRQGRRFALAAAVYVTARFGLDFLRERELRYGVLTPMQWTVLALSVVAAVAGLSVNALRASATLVRDRVRE
jgi:phosphatidylglycerol:prolipoprotein diacylglycerol transferase